MALKNLIARHKRRRDAGVGVVDAIVGIGLAFLIIGGPIIFFTVMNQSAAGAAATQEKNTSISEALGRTVANVQSSDMILYAAENELVIRSTEVDPGKADSPLITRWVVNGTTLYQQAWTGEAGVASYSRATLPAEASGTGNQITRVSVGGLTLDKPLFSYTDKDGAALSVTAPNSALTESPRTSPDDKRTTYDIALVTMGIKASTIKDGFVENATSAAPRSVSGKSDGNVASAMCAAVSLSTSPAGKPVITWNVLSGYDSYMVMRNSSLAAVVNVPATSTQGRWEDTTIAPGPAEVVNYRVQARDASTGAAASLACAPKPWSPRIAAPVFRNSTVLPSADEAPEWTTGTDGALGLKKPRIVLNWSAVPGASSYELKYRQLDPVTGTPLSSAFTSAAAGLPAATTTFTWNEGGWASSYEWFILANARTGQSIESAHITTLTHPPAPQNVNIAPEYGTGSSRLTTGNNVITWDAAPTAIGYDIWKYNSGSSGPVTRIGQVGAGVRTFTHAEPYGTTSTYYVAAVNDGPRGTTSGRASSANPEAGVSTATGVMPTASYREPVAGISTAASFKGMETLSMERVVSATTVDPAPKPVSQLQYPPVPNVDAVASRDYDGYNQLSWKPAVSAIGYQVARFDKSGAKTCLTQKCGDPTTGGVNATTLKDNASKGTQSDYAVLAYNATGLSVEFSAKETMTQRPEVPALTVVRSPGLTDRTADFRIVQNADAGNAGANKFCTTATCKYELKKSTSVLTTASHTQSGALVNWTKADSPDGSTTTFSARSKNAAVFNGGYSDSRAVTVKTYPGKFSALGKIGNRNGGQKARYRLSVTAMDLGKEANGATAVEWGSVPGANKVAVVRRSLGGDTITTNGGTSGLSLSTAPSTTVASGAAGKWDNVASPGAAFQYEITAQAPNGLKRTVKTQPVLTPADISRAGTMVITCSGTDDRRFTQAQIGYTSDGSFWRGAYSKPYPYQQIGAQMVWSDSKHPESLDGRARYGAAKGTTYLGVASKGTNVYSGNSYYYTGWNYSLTGQWSTSKGDFANGPGVGYYQGVNAGFYAVTRGAARTLTDPATNRARVYQGPDSYYVNPSVSVYATFQVNCAPAGTTGKSLIEPKDACYTFNGTACNDPAYWNRPKWTSR